MLSEFIMREGDSERDEMMKCERRKSGFHKRNIAVDRTAAHEVFREQGGGIRFGSVHAEFVISLLVAPGIDGGSHLESLRVDGDVLHAERVQPYGGGKPCRSASDNEGVECFHARHRDQKRSMVSPPSTLMTCPVE